MEYQITLTEAQENKIVVESLKDYYDIVDCEMAKMAINIILQHYLTDDEFNEWKRGVI